MYSFDLVFLYFILQSYDFLHELVDLSSPMVDLSSSMVHLGSSLVSLWLLFSNRIVRMLNMAVNVI